MILLRLWLSNFWGSWPHFEVHICLYIWSVPCFGLSIFVVHVVKFIAMFTWWQFNGFYLIDSTQVPQYPDYHTFASEAAFTLLVISTKKLQKKIEEKKWLKKKVSHSTLWEHHLVCTFVTLGDYNFFSLVLHIVIARVCNVGRRDIWLGSLHVWWIHVPIRNWIYVVFHDILTIGKRCHCNLMIFI